MEEEWAKKFAEEKFLALPELEQQWNYYHSKCMIKALKELTNKSEVLKKLIPLCWVHDIGKIQGEEDHASKSVNILKGSIELDMIEEDCILNHGSSSKPLTVEGKIFRYCDGLSLFYSDIINFIFYAGALEGKRIQEIKEKIEDRYEKYRGAYSESEEAVSILDRLFQLTR